MDLEQQLTDKIRQALPDFVFTSSKVITHGWNDIVLIADDTMVFTFPRDMDDSREQLQKELKLLPLIQKHVDLPVPNFSFVAADQSFAGYPMIPGVPLTPKIFEQLPPEAQVSAAAAVGRFLQELHGVPVRDARKCGVEDAWSVAEANAWLRGRVDIIKQAVTTDEERSRIDELMQKLQTRSTVADRVLTHNDLSPDHILFNDPQKFVTGIIDFGDTQFDDPAVDFGKLWELGDPFVDLALNAYSPSDVNFKARTKAHFTHYFLANLYYGLKQHNDNYLARGRRALQGFL